MVARFVHRKLIPFLLRDREKTGAILMRGLVGRGLSFNKKRTSGAQKANDFQNIFGSDIVSTESILSHIDGVKKNPNITKLELEDLVTSCHHQSMLPNIKLLLTSDDRPWESLKFVDGIPFTDFEWFQALKEDLLQDYGLSSNQSNAALQKLLQDKPDLLSVQANVQFSSTTLARDMRTILKSLLEDSNLKGVTFSGALFAVAYQDIPKRLSHLLESCDNEKRSLTEEVIVHATFGRSVTGEAMNDDKKLLQACIKVLKTGKAVSISRRPDLQRCVTAPAISRTLSRSNSPRLGTARVAGGLSRSVTRKGVLSNQTWNKDRSPTVKQRVIRTVSSSNDVRMHMRICREQSPSKVTGDVLTSKGIQQPQRKLALPRVPSRTSSMSKRCLPGKSKSLNAFKDSSGQHQCRSSAAERLAMLNGDHIVPKGSDSNHSSLSRLERTNSGGVRRLPVRTSSRRISKQKSSSSLSESVSKETIADTTTATTVNDNDCSIVSPTKSLVGVPTCCDPASTTITKNKVSNRRKIYVDSMSLDKKLVVVCIGDDSATTATESDCSLDNNVVRSFACGPESNIDDNVDEWSTTRGGHHSPTSSTTRAA